VVPDWREQWIERQRREEERRARWQPHWDAERQALKTCPLKGPDADKPGCCGLCGGPLPVGPSGRVHPMRRWCSRACSATYWNNHGWASASAARCTLDGWRCVKCGKLGAGTTMPPWAVRSDSPLVLVSLQVNHRIPRNGRGYQESCAHHQDNLETLCTPCHGREPSRQITARKLARHLRVLIGIRTGELRVDWTRASRHPRTRRIEAASFPLWEEVAS